MSYRGKNDLEVIELLQKYDLNIIYNNSPESYTWSNKRYKSYLDYFMIRQMTYEQFSVLEKIGTSDHKAIEITITEACPLRVRQTNK